MRYFYSLIIIILFLSCQSNSNTLRNKYFGKKAKETEKKKSTKTSYNSKRELAATKLELNSFLDSWMGSPYRYGGNSKTGIDCSAFTQRFFKDVLNLNIKRTTVLQYQEGRFVKRAQLAYGDLVFFRINGPRARVDHVGVYLSDGNFVHASTSKGVTISNLSEKYFNDRYTGSRRIR